MSCWCCFRCCFVCSIFLYVTLSSAALNSACDGGKVTRDQRKNIWVLRAIIDAVLEASEEIVVSFIDSTAPHKSLTHIMK